MREANIELAAAVRCLAKAKKSKPLRISQAVY